jgi:hypothetical protein
MQIMFSYVAYGLGLHSLIELPELQESSITGEVVIRFGHINLPTKSGTQRYLGGTKNETYLYWKKVGTFLVRNGREIVIQPDSDVEECVLRLFLLGPVMGVLLLQRGLPVFHASVVVLSSGAIAFLAAKYYGKSTMAAILYSRGYDLASDDVMVLDAKADQLMVRPGFPQMKLWPDALVAINEPVDSHPKLHSSTDKRAYGVFQRFAQGLIPLRRVFALEFGDVLEIVPLKPSESLLHVMPHWYGNQFDAELLKTFGLDTHFRDCTQLVRHVPVYLLRRPRSLDMLPDVAKLIIEHLSDTTNQRLQGFP